jgi:hypothetical protein
VLALCFSADGSQVFVKRVAISLLRAPSLKQVFCLGVPKAGCSELSLGILAGSNVQLRPNTCTVAGKSLNRFQPTLRSGRRALPGRRQRIPGTFPLVARTTEVGEKQMLRTWPFKQWRNASQISTEIGFMKGKQSRSLQASVNE